MKEQQCYRVRLDNIPETDQLIVKLIFSIAAKAKGRQKVYTLADQHTGAAADIIISNTTTAGDGNQQHVIHFIDQQTPSLPQDYYIQRPLIATRVLSLLDRYVSEKLSAPASLPDTISAPEATAPCPDAVSTDGINVEFCISEEEASQLAIVEDETLANPANKDIAKDTGKSNLLTFHRHEAGHKETDPNLKHLKQAAVNKPRVLVVDDSPSVRKQIELELQLFDVDVDFAESVTQSQQCLGSSQYDVAFLDVMLPDGNGFQICKHIKHMGNKMKVIMLTGKATPADKIKGTMAGCDAYLVKPVGRMTFQNTVCNYLKLKNQREAMNA